ncbi:MAG: sugar ABC transporter permease [Clostridiales bacterium]|nr:sugar ABC transporter permease [Clostridiales bacterium]
MITYLKEKNTKFYFSLPTILFLFIMVIFPILFTLYSSVTNSTLSAASGFVGFSNYRQLFQEARFWDSMGNTIYFTITASIFETFLGLLFAILLNRAFRGKTLVKTMFLLPFAATPVAIAMTWQLIYDPNMGIVNAFIALFGMEPKLWLASTETALNCLIFIEIWQGTAIVALIISAGLSLVPDSLYEAAGIDGASSWKCFFHITLPSINNTVFMAFILRFIEVIKAFDIIYATTKGGPMHASETLNIYGYLKAFQYFQFGSASALITMFTIVVTIIGTILLKIKKLTTEG